MGFSVLDLVIFLNSSWHKQYLPLLQSAFYQSNKLWQKKGSRNVVNTLLRVFYISLLFSNTRRVLSQYDRWLRLLDLLIIISISPKYWSLENKHANRTWASIFGWAGLVEGRLTTFGEPVILGRSLLSGYNWGHNLLMILAGGRGGGLFSCKFTVGVVTVGASAVNCDCFFSVDLLVTVVRHFLIYSFIHSFIHSFLGRCFDVPYAFFSSS